MSTIGWLKKEESRSVLGIIEQSATNAKMPQLIESMNVVGRMSNSAAAAMRPITVKRNMRSVCIQ